MSCRRAFEIDLPGFLDDPRAPAWDEFRAHYPRCATCAAEVAAWTAVHEALASRHPEPAELLRWSDAPDDLSPVERARIAAHVERCASCHDELRALTGFTADAYGVPAANASRASAGADTVAPTVASDAGIGAGSVPPTRGPGTGRNRLAAHLPSAVRGGGRHPDPHPPVRPGTARATEHDAGTRRARGVIRRVLWHPAFAYAALAVLLLLPTFRSAFDDAATELALQRPEDGERAVADDARPVAAMQPQAPPDATAVTAPRAPAAAPPRAPDAAPAAPAEPAHVEKRQADAEQDAAAHGDARSFDARVDRTAPRLLRQAPPRSVPAPAPGEARGRAVADDATSGAGRDAALAGARSDATGVADAVPAARSPSVAPPPAAAHIPMERGQREETAAQTTGAIRLVSSPDGDRTIVVTLPDDAPRTGLELRVRDDAGGREFRARASTTEDDREVSVALPQGFRAPTLQVELWSDGTRLVVAGAVGG